jgi:hypothetical protein
MIDYIFYCLLVLVVGGALLYAFNALAPVPEGVKKAVNIIGGVILFLVTAWLLLGILKGAPVVVESPPSHRSVLRQ